MKMGEAGAPAISRASISTWRVKLSRSLQRVGDMLKGGVITAMAAVAAMQYMPEVKGVSQRYLLQPPERLEIEMLSLTGETKGNFACQVFPMSGSTGQLVITDRTTQHSQTYNCR